MTGCGMQATCGARLRGLNRVRVLATVWERHVRDMVHQCTEREWCMTWEWAAPYHVSICYLNVSPRCLSSLLDSGVPEVGIVICFLLWTHGV